MTNIGFEQAAWEAFQEAASEKYDFATCQRADGSKYGSPGRCIQGTETTPGPSEKKSSSAKSSGGGGGDNPHPGAGLSKTEVELLSSGKRKQATTEELKNQNKLIKEQMAGADKFTKAALKDEAKANTAEIKSRGPAPKAAATAAPKADASAGLVNGKLSSKHPDAIADKAARKELAAAKKEVKEANAYLNTSAGKTGKSGGALSAGTKAQQERSAAAEARLKKAEAEAKKTGDKVKKTTAGLLKKGGGGSPSKPTGTPNKEGEFDPKKPSRGIGKDKLKDLEISRNKARRAVEAKDSSPGADKRFRDAEDKLRVEKQKQSIQNRADKLTAGQTFKVQGKEYRVNSDGSYQLVDS